MDEIPIVSHSQLTTLDRCSFAWDISYVKGWRPKERKRSLETGSMIHELLAVWYREQDERCVDEAIEKWLETANTETFALQSAAHAAWLVKEYIQKFAPSHDRFEIISVEEHFEIPLVTPKGREYHLQGYTDLVTRQEGQIWLWDHKSGAKFWNPTEVMMDSQMPLYAAAMRAQGRDVFGIVINMLNTYDYKDKSKATPDKLFRRELTYRTPEELNAILLNAGMMVDEIIDGPEIRRSLRKDCSFCQFQEPCLLSLKGLPIEDILPATCELKSSYQREPVGVLAETQIELF